MFNQKILDKIRKLIKNDNLEDALDLIESHKDELFNGLSEMETDTLYAKLKRAETLFWEGNISEENANITRNKIRSQIIDILTNRSRKKSREHEVLEQNNKPIYTKFILQGNEPGWTISIEENRIVFINDYGESITIYPIEKFFSGDRIWHFKSRTCFESKVKRIQITICREETFDDMSGEKYDYSVVVIENFRIYNGVGITKK